MNALMMYLSGSVGGVVVNVLLAFVCVYPGKHEKDQFFQVLDTQKWRKFHLNIVRTMAAKLPKGWFVYQLLPKVVCCTYKTAHSVGNLLERCYVCNIQCGHYSKILSFYSYELFVMAWIIILRSLLFHTRVCWPLKERLSSRYFKWGNKSLFYIGWQTPLPKSLKYNLVPSLVYLVETFTINWMSSIRQYGLVFSLCVFIKAGRMSVMKSKLSLNLVCETK